MTETQSTEAPVVIDSKTAALVRSGIERVAKGEIDFADLVATVTTPEPLTIVSKAPPKAMALSKDALEAIKALPEIFAKVNVEKDRALTKPEAQALIEERQVIDTLLGVLEKRKTDTIREVLANHMDHVFADEVAKDPRGVRTDPNGHTAPWETQNFDVEGTDRKIQRFATGGKPVLNTRVVETLWSEEKITREQYLALTSKPESPRVLDMAKVNKACKADPGLFFVLAAAAAEQPSKISTTVKVAKA